MKRLGGTPVHRRLPSRIVIGFPNSFLESEDNPAGLNENTLIKIGFSDSDVSSSS